MAASIEIPDPWSIHREAGSVEIVLQSPGDHLARQHEDVFAGEWLPGNGQGPLSFVGAVVEPLRGEIKAGCPQSRHHAEALRKTTGHQVDGDVAPVVALDIH